ncbi:bifunctional glycosyltransferase/CDP-glycerol:glycerophosphate glycerophosphotransferase [Arthrobacter psychrolactophilus]|uniref:bifunctional glycosyltransferase/CDP-glycerol:glycerophosphate glycerophosphotransferase n=1 Tax=Arthrobacter psychrolactophilus TaxID=92442 RepID=UPI0015E8932B|nr:CDP-glycerol glycerophosphotransferase family protein [Arthrobacter psychrolactophilus]
MSSSEEVLFSVVIAVYNNAEYASDLYRSLECQSKVEGGWEVIIVNDGSTDSSLSIAENWQKKSRLNIRVLDKTNSGVSVARNHGISECSGKWITFVDSDDVLHRDYMASLEDFLRRDRHNMASLLATRSVIYNEKTGILVDNHPLAWKFKHGDRLVDINQQPHVVHLGGHATVVRRDFIEANSIRFNENVRPGFEDADFIGRYLGKFERPVIGLVASARYYYRKRSNGTSLIDTTWTKPEKFSHEPKYGHLGMLRSITADRGYTPKWAQNTVLYSLYWYFLADRSWNSPIAGVQKQLLDDFWVVLHEIMMYIDVDVLRQFSLRNYGWYLSEGIIRQFKNNSWVKSEGHTVYRWGGITSKKKTQKFVYSYIGVKPKEQFFVDGKRVTPVHTNTVVNRAFDHELMTERILNLPSHGKVRIWLDNKEATIVRMPPFNRLPSFADEMDPDLILSGESKIVSPHAVTSEYKKANGGLTKKAIVGINALASRGSEEAWVNNKYVIRSVYDILSRVVKRKYQNWIILHNKSKDAKILRASLQPEVCVNYKHAWIFIDRPDRGDDNAEHLYRYVRKNHPNVNIWFLIEESAPDWNRLSADGFNLLPYGSEKTITAVLNAKFILSSHMDAGIFDLIDRKRFGATSAKRVFLQHGMNMNDISKWLNTKDLPLMITSARPELEALVSERSQYRISKREAKLTGLPRHDKLVKMSKETPVSERQNILIAPTWRKYLSDDMAVLDSEVARRDFILGTDFYKSWQGLLNSTTIREMAQRNGLNIVFALHDHLTEFARLFDFGDHVSVLPYREMSVQKMLANTRLLVTDYSSLSTEAAIANSPVIYYQFDSESIYSGKHSFKKDWFDYKINGFGPVCNSQSSVEGSLIDIESNAWEPFNLYKKRLSETLPYLDGSACARVVHQIMKIA